MYSRTETKYTVSAQFLSNDYSIKNYVVDSSTEDIQTAVGAKTNNSNSFVAHTVAYGDTLSSLAQRYSVSASAIRKLNGFSENDVLNVGSVIYVSSQEGLVYVPTETTSLFVFANLYDLSLDHLMQANDEQDSMKAYRPGQAIFIPNKDKERAYQVALLSKPIVVEEKKPQSVPRALASTNVSRQRPLSVGPSSSPLTSKKTSIVSSRKERVSENYGFAAGNCTQYAAAKADFAFGRTSDGKVYKGWAGNAVDRLSNAKRAGFKTSKTPSVGAIGVMSNGGNGNSAGHVVIVEKVDKENNRIQVSDMNYLGNYIVTLRWIDMNDAMTQSVFANQKFIGFIPSQVRP